MKKSRRTTRKSVKDLPKREVTKDAANKVKGGQNLNKASPKLF